MLSGISHTLTWTGLVTLAVFFAEMLYGYVDGVFAVMKLVEFLAILYIALNLRILQKGGEKLAAGDYSQSIDTRPLIGDFKRYGQRMNELRTGMERAVREQTRAERMKTELITNVSHDIKTPLTSIVNYVDLLQKVDVQPETAREYIAVLDRQSRRLKKLTEDAGLAFEVIESIPVHEDIKLGKPSRDQYIANYCENIRRVAEAGIKCICYNFMPVFDWTRTQLDHELADGSTSLVYYQDQVDKVNRWGHHGHARGWGYRAMSDAQRAKFDKIMEEFAPRMEQLRDSIYVKRQELRALENATNPDVKAVREAATEMARLRNEMADLHDALGDKLAAEVGVPEGFKDAPHGPRGPRGDRGPAMDCPRGDGPRGDAGYYDGPHRGHY